MPATAHWTNVNGGLVDLPAAGFDSRFAIDGFMHTFTQAGGLVTNAVDWYLVITADSVFGDFDAVVVVHENLGGTGSTSNDLIVEAQIDSGPGWGSPVTLATMATVTGSQRRLTAFSLDAGGTPPERISGAGFFRLKFSKTSGDDITPAITQVALIRRRPLPYAPNQPWDNIQQALGVEVGDANRPIAGRRSLAPGRHRLALESIMIDEAARADYDAFWLEAKRGARAFWFIETPNTDPRPYYMRATTGLRMPLEGAGPQRTLALGAIEEGGKLLIDEIADDLTPEPVI